MTESDRSRAARRWLRRAPVALLVVMTCVAGWSTVSLANHGPAADPIPGFDGVTGGKNANCADIYPTATEFRINMPSDGTFTDGTITVAVDIYDTGPDNPEGPKFDFNVTSGPPIAAVAVKGGPRSQMYDYLGQSAFDVDPPADAAVTADHRLHSPVNSENNKFFGLSHISFCYFELATKSGTKFADLNGDGVRDPGEPGVGGVTIRAYADNDASNDVLDADEFAAGPVASAVTAANGSYLLTLIPGEYIVCEVVPVGTTQTFPANTICAAGAPPLGTGGYAVGLAAGENETGNDFGNFVPAIKSGTKFDDLNGNGVFDNGEPGVGGVTIRAYADDDAANDVLDADEFAAGPAASAVTDAAGNYTLTLDPGDYIVCEVLPAGATQTFPANTLCNAGAPTLAPGGYAITLISGENETGNDFGNFQRATKSGTKFNDRNGDGDRDSGEPGLPGVVIRAYVDANDNDVLDAGEITVPPAATDTTDAAGAYTLTLNPGEYIVCEVLPADFTQTLPANSVCAAGVSAGLAPGGYAITLTSGEDETGNNFGNRQRPDEPGYGQDPDDDLDPEDPYGLDPADNDPEDPYIPVTPTTPGTDSTPVDLPAGVAGQTANLGDPVVGSDSGDQDRSAAPVPGGMLPRTGAGLLAQGSFGLLLVGGGLVAMRIGRRRRANPQA